MSLNQTKLILAMRITSCQEFSWRPNQTHPSNEEWGLLLVKNLVGDQNKLILAMRNEGYFLSSLQNHSLITIVTLPTMSNSTKNKNSRKSLLSYISPARMAEHSRSSEKNGYLHDSTCQAVRSIRPSCLLPLPTSLTNHRAEERRVREGREAVCPSYR